MGRQRDGVKERYWRELIRKWECSELSTGEFCWQHEIEQHQLHWWRRILERRDAEARSSGGGHSRDMRRPADVSAKSLLRRESACEATDFKGANAFVQVLLPTDSNGTAELEITHPGGCRIRVRHTCDQQLLASVLAVLDSGVTHAAGGV
jgi:hypothetical protein